MNLYSANTITISYSYAVYIVLFKRFRHQKLCVKHFTKSQRFHMDTYIKRSSCSSYYLFN